MSDSSARNTRFRECTTQRANKIAKSEKYVHGLLTFFGASSQTTTLVFNEHSCYSFQDPNYPQYNSCCIRFQGPTKRLVNLASDNDVCAPSWHWNSSMVQIPFARFCITPFGEPFCMCHSHSNILLQCSVSRSVIIF